ncbi:MAG: hypothetical protein AAGI06_04490 [Pseudomonadota bacterium]
MQTPEEIHHGGARVLVYRDAPDWEGLKCAAVGGVQFEDAASGEELLNTLADQLRSEGFQGLLGPMDGDTWHAYRVVTETDGSPPFLMEPVSGEHTLSAFTQAEFQPVSSYVSSRACLEDTLSPEPVSVPGVTVTPWDGKDGDTLIRQLFQMSAGAFARNKFFKPIEIDAFLALYEPVMPLIDARHVLFAHHEEAGLVGFLFGMPDRSATDEAPAAILKTYASGMRGVGHLLAETYHRSAVDMGHSHVIHALMHEDNASLSRSKQHKAHIFRRYALMGRKL